jgi:hypothetical protein
MFKVCLCGMAHDLQKFLAKCDPILGLALSHLMWNPPSITFSEPEILVQNADAGCLRDPQLLTHALG